MKNIKRINFRFLTLICLNMTLFTISIKSKAQDNDFLLSSSKAEYTAFIFGADKKYFYTYYDEDETTILFESLTINTLKSKVKTKIVLPKIDDKKQKFENILHINQSSYLFTSTYDKKSKIYSFYTYKVNDSGQLDTEGIKIDEILSKENGDRNYINFSMSNDSNNILILKTFDKIVSSDEIKGQISYKVLDENLKIVYSNKIELEKPLIEYSISNLLLENNNLYYLTCEQHYNKKIKDTRRNYTVNLYNSKDSKLYKCEVDIDEIHMLDANFLINQNGQLICTGTYAIEKKFNDQWPMRRCLKGVFYEMFNKNNLTFITKNKTNITEQFKDYPFYNYPLRHYFVQENNKLIVICENKFTRVSEGGLRLDYYDGPLIVTSFDLKNANNTWSKIIEKDNKKSTNKCTPQSYILFKKQTSFKILYNCNRQVDIDEKGNVDDVYIFPESLEFNETFISYPGNDYYHSNYFQTNYNSIILSTSSKNNGDKFSKLFIK